MAIMTPTVIWTAPDADAKVTHKCQHTLKYYEMKQPPYGKLPLYRWRNGAMGRALD